MFLSFRGRRYCMAAPFFWSILRSSLFFFQNEEIFVQLDELDELDKIIHARMGLNYSLTQAQKTL